jgi:predicted nucleic acid-binding protein
VPKPKAPSDVEVRDVDDRWVLATDVAGTPDVLVTGDRELLDARAQAPIRILDPREFWEMVREGSIQLWSCKP